jgi:hypothetical protein
MGGSGVSRVSIQKCEVGAVSIQKWDKRHGGFEPTYIQLLTDEFRQTVPVNRAPPHIFVDEATSLTNISDGYSSLMWPQRRTYGLVKVILDPSIFVGAHPKPMNLTYIRWFRVPMNIF